MLVILHKFKTFWLLVTFFIKHLVLKTFWLLVTFFIKQLVLMSLNKLGVAEPKNGHLIKITWTILLQRTVPHDLTYITASTTFCSSWILSFRAATCSTKTYLLHVSLGGCIGVGHIPFTTNVLVMEMTLFQIKIAETPPALSLELDLFDNTFKKYTLHQNHFPHYPPPPPPSCRLLLDFHN